MLSARHPLLGVLLGIGLALPATAAAQPLIQNVQVSETSPVLIINGSNFSPPIPEVWLDSVQLSIVSLTATQVMANLPPKASGTYLVRLNRGGQDAFAQVTIGVVGRLVAPPLGLANSLASYSSAPLTMAASTRNLLTSDEERQTFQWQVDPLWNNTSNPSARLGLSFGSGASTAPTGLSIGENGVIAFAPGQTFPGIVTGVTAGAGLTMSGAASNPTLSVAPGAITGTMIANESITGVDIADGQVSAADLAFDPATQAELDAHRASGDHDDLYYTRTKADSLFFPVRTTLITSSMGADGSPDATFTSILMFGAFNKQRASSSLLVMWNSVIHGVGFPYQSNYCEYQIRIDGQAALGGAGRVHSRLPDSSASATALFTGLAAGLHHVNIYVRGDAKECWINPNQLPQTIIIEEAGN